MPDRFNSPEEFRDHVVRTLAELRIGQAQVIKQLEKMNGTQANLLKRMADVEAFEKIHPLECPLKSDVNEIGVVVNKHIIEAGTKLKGDKAWMKRLWPYIHMLIGMILLLILTHANELMDSLK